MPTSTRGHSSRAAVMSIIWLDTRRKRSEALVESEIPCLA
jgi:hypothetical protein